MSSKKQNETAVVVAAIQGATLAERLTAIRVETQNIHADALRRERQALDERITSLVSHRAHQIVDALLLTE